MALSLMRLAQFRLESAGEGDWWSPPPWNKDKDRPSVLDVERLFRRHAGEIRQLLSDWLGDGGNSGEGWHERGLKAAATGIRDPPPHPTAGPCSGQRASAATTPRPG